MIQIYSSRTLFMWRDLENSNYIHIKINQAEAIIVALTGRKNFSNLYASHSAPIYQGVDYLFRPYSLHTLFHR